MKTVPLQKLIAALPEGQSPRVEGPGDRPVSGLRYDSRRVGGGDVFFAWKGEKADGHAHIPAACRQGAAAIVHEGETEREGEASFVRVTDARRALAWMAAGFHDFPAQKLATVGITGTNGKTTTAFAAKHLLGGGSQGPIGLVGTIRYEIGDEYLPAPRTTPEGSDLQELLARMVEAGCRTAVMEASSHALDQGRTDGIDFSVGVFTNLTPDHLDYHVTMEAYFEAKRRLFDGRTKAAVINIDDPFGARLLGQLGKNVVQRLPFSAAGNPDAVLWAERVEASAEGTAFDFCFGRDRLRIRIPLIGSFNVANALGAAGAALALGRGFGEVAERLATLLAVPGRLERFGGGGLPVVAVDYAHTEDAVRKALLVLRGLKPRRLLAVLGCGGNRDKTKRPKMAAAAATLADRAYFTADNPRGETVEAIFADMKPGVPAGSDALWIADRREAIARAIADARPGDVVCVAGKGHEATQEVNGVFSPFSDRDVVAEILGGTR